MIYADFKRKQMLYDVISGDSLTEVEGVPPLALLQSRGDNLEQYKIYANTIDNNSVGDRTTNLFDISQGITKKTQKGCYILDNKLYTEYSGGNELAGFMNQYIPVTPNTTYVHNYNYVGGDRVIINLYDSDKNLILNSSISIGTGWSYLAYYKGYFGSGVKHSFTVPSNCYYIQLVYVCMSTAGAGNYNIYSNIQIAESPFDSSYEPYGYKIPVIISNKQNGPYAELPSEYQQVEYLESTGTQYIDTGVIAKSGQKCKYKFSVNDVYSGNAIGGVFNNNNDIYYGIVRSANQKLSYRYKDTFYAGNTSLQNNTVYEAECELKVGNQTLKLNNQLETSSNASNNINTNLSAYIFQCRNVATSPFKGKIYYFKIYDNDVLVRNFIPCYRKSDNVAGMYDTVNNVFYTNQGTDTFTVGANVNTTITNIYLDEPLRKNGNNADYIDFKLQKAYRYSDGTETSITLPTITTVQDNCYLIVDTTVNPSNALVKYYKN